MKTGFKIVGAIITILLSLLTMNQAYFMLNQPSNVDVGIGIFILLGMIIFITYCVNKVVGYFKNLFKKES